MLSETVFGGAASDIDIVIRLVKREATEECSVEQCLLMPVLDRCVTEAVSNLWGSRVRAFVPLLALRRVRCCIQAGSCDCGEC